MTKLKILQVELENYRQFAGKQTVDFSPSDARNITIIQGANGAGKTNLLNAITWCLYGKEEHLKRTPKEYCMNITNIQVLNDLAPGESVEARVKLSLGDEHPRYIFERGLTATKEKSTNRILEEESYFHAFFLLNKNWKDSVQPSVTVNGLLPEALRSFFFFDGERLDDFFLAGNEGEVRRAILDVSQIGLLDLAIEHLDSISTRIHRDAGSLSSRSLEFTEKINAAKKAQGTLKAELEELRKQKTETAKNLATIESKLRKHNLEMVREYQKQRDRLAEEIESREQALDRLRQNILDHLLRIGPLLYANQAISQTRSLIMEKYQRGELPPKIRESFLADLLDGGKCICGSDISRNGPLRANIKKLYSTAKFSALDEQITDGRFKVDSFIRAATQFKEEHTRLEKEHNRLNSELEKDKERLKEVSTKLEGIDDAQIETLENQRLEFERANEKLAGDIRVKETQLDGQENRIKEWNQEREKELRKEKRHHQLATRMKLCQDGIAVLRKVKEELVGEIRRTIEAHTKKYFLDLIWKKDTYVDVRIDETYRVSVLNRLGSESLGSLGAGERQVLALAFMAALTKVSGFEAPVVIDTPLGRISGEPKENIAKSLPSYLQDTQLTLLVTDQEYTRIVRERISNRVGKEYLLDYHEEDFKTVVKPV